MSVIVRRQQDKEYRIYVKGSPEIIIDLCKPQSVPANWHSILDFYA